MAHLSGFVAYRIGAIDFTVSGTSIDGRYGILGPRGMPNPLVRDGTQLPQDAPEVAEILRLLQKWLEDQNDPDSPAAKAALKEMDALPYLPDHCAYEDLLRSVHWAIGTLQS